MTKVMPQAAGLVDLIKKLVILLRLHGKQMVAVFDLLFLLF